MSANDVSLAHQAFNNLMTTLTPAQIQQFVQQMQANPANFTNSGIAANAGNAGNTGNATNAGNTANTGNTTNAGNTANAGPVASNNALMTTATTTGPASVATPNRSRGKRAGENTKLRPLNSFIAFRSFYSAIFPELTQKVKSGLLRFLWKSDPYKAKWAILAKAYSVVRDDNPGKGVTLESFLTLNSEFIGIVAPADYLNAMGLELIVDGDGNYSLAGGNPASVSNPTSTTTNHSVDDIVSRCYDTGYVTGTAPTNGNGHQGAFAAQPNVSVNPNNNVSSTAGNLGANATHPNNNGVATNAIAATGGNGNTSGGNAAVAAAPITNNGNGGGANANVGGGNAGIATNNNFWNGTVPDQVIDQVTGEILVPYYGLFLPGAAHDDSDFMDFHALANM